MWETTVLAVIMHPIEIVSSTVQTKTNQLFKRLIGLDIPNETRFEPNHLKTVYPNRIGPKINVTINGNGQENVLLEHFSQINQNRPTLKRLMANETSGTLWK